MKNKRAIAPAEILGIICGVAAAGLFSISPYLSAAVLSAFVAACLAAPFFPPTGLFLPVIRRGRRDTSSVAVTFDDGPDSRTTPFLLELLARFGVHATFFIPGKKALAHPELVNSILGAGHAIGNHTFTHDVLVMLKSQKTLACEIDDAQKVLGDFGLTPLTFRPPAGVVNPKLGAVLKNREMVCIHYSRRGPDIGNRWIQGLSGKILAKIRSGDIVLLHDCCPQSASFSVEIWLAEIEKILAGLPEKGLRVVPLGELIERPLMKENIRKSQAD
ncbi:MAG: polysaccharide deacetylase family protein [Desulfobacterales bacterium]|nr:polysaccharide deacetylase family protein [Desulfobacterales bacterium]